MKKLAKLLIVLILLFFVGSCKDDDDDSTFSNPKSNSSVGALAEEYLSDHIFRSLEVEIVYEEGAKPTDQAIDNLKSFLGNYLEKPQGISTVWTKIPDQNQSTYTLAELSDIESNYRSVTNGSNLVTAYFFFANGNYSEDTDNSTTLGIAYNSSSMVVFEKTINENTGGVGKPSASTIEEAVAKHEFGHILGLVNLGTPMVNNHQDEAHGKHCTNTDCLMYYATETGDLFSSILGSGVPQLGPDCQADLSANGGK